MKTSIGWTDYTWNPVTGCSKVSAGCAYCYAERLSSQRGWTRLPWTAAHEAENVRTHADRIRELSRVKAGSYVFACSMGDLFHRRVPDEFLHRVFAAMARRPDLTFQVLTKRPERAAEWPGPWGPNVWLGTSIENADALYRLDILRRCPAALRFLSCEPLLGPLDGLDLTGIGWVICGGESGPHHRPMEMAWARALRDLCKRENVPFFYKQDAGYRPETRPYIVEVDGRHTTVQEMPPRREANAIAAAGGIFGGVSDAQR